MYDCIMYLRICINLGGEILVFYRVVRPASVWQQVCVIRVRFLTNWMKRLAWSAVADTLTPELLRWWWRQIVTLWHDVREMFRLEAGCRDQDLERTPGKLWTRLRHQSLISPFLRHLSHGTQLSGSGDTVRGEDRRASKMWALWFKDKLEYH